MRPRFFKLCFCLLLATRAFAFAESNHFCQTRLLDTANFEDLKIKIEICHLSSVEALISLLSETTRSHYVLLHHSQSLQAASFLAPRAILYGKDAKLILSFNGDRSQSHFDHLEVMQFRDETRRFEARDIQFAKTVVISKANPPLCLSCHQDDPRPNWDTYPLWPGAYGGEDDSVFRVSYESTSRSEDEGHFQEFLRNGKNHGRYRFLAARPAPSLPNTDFGSALARLNHLRIAQKIKESQALEPYRLAILGASACFYASTPAEGFIPAALRHRFKTPLSAFLRETAQTNQKEFLARIDFLRGFYTEAPESLLVQEDQYANETTDSLGRDLVSDRIVASLRWIVENQSVSTADWGMQAAFPSYDFEYGYTGIADLQSALHRILSDPSLQNARFPSGCEDLQAQSLARLKSI